MPIEVSFVSEVADPAAFEALLLEYYQDVLPIAEAAGVPSFVPQMMVDASLDQMSSMLPPDGRLVLAHSPHGRLLGCGTLRRIRPDAVEMKRMYVRPEARGKGVGQRLFDMRIEEARHMGCRAVYADTAQGNRPMLSMYERFGFRYIQRYPENANPLEYEPYLVYLEYRFDDAA